MTAPLIFQAVTVAFVIYFAYMNSLWIKRDHAFRHWANALVAISCASYAGLTFGWNYGLAILFLARSLFDGSLSLFRGLSFDYVSPKPASRIDQVEKRVFGKDGYTPKIIYLTVAIILNFV